MSTILPILQQSDIFFELSPHQLSLIAALCSEKSYDSNAIIFNENDPSKELYIIAEGAVDIQVEPSLVGSSLDVSPGPVTIATLRRGQNFGEMALVDRGLRSATARAAAAHTRLLVIPRDGLMALCNTEPRLGFHLMRNLAADMAAKIRNTGLDIREKLLYGRD